MIRSVKVTNYRGDSILLDLANPWETGFAVTSLTGIGPNKTDINTVEIATQDGVIFNSARTGSRNIVMKIQFVGDDIEACRRKSYRYFPVKQRLTMEFTTDTRKSTISGYVESNEVSIWSKNETAQISIICPDPYFKAVGSDNAAIAFYGHAPAFEFPFENEDGTASLETGSIATSSQANLLYAGDADTGVIFNIHATGDAKNITLYNLDYNETMVLNVTMVAGDDLVVNTCAGQKSVTLIHEGTPTNILNKLDKNPTWFKVRAGDNTFAYAVEEGLDNLTLTAKCITLYEGL